MISSVFIILEVNGIKTYRGVIKSVWIYYEDALFTLENYYDAKQVDEAKGFVFTDGKKYYRLIEKNLYKRSAGRSF